LLRKAEQERQLKLAINYLEQNIKISPGFNSYILKPTMCYILYVYISFHSWYSLQVQ
jgi:hypothetical protein